MDDPEGPLVVTKIPYFPAYVHLVEHKLDQLLCIAGPELSYVRDVLRSAAADRKYAEIVASEGDAIRQQVTDELSAGGNTPTQAEIDAEVESRIQDKVK